MAEAKTPTAAPVEEVKNCPSCKKPLKKARRYYRNNSYYCNANCFKKAKASAVSKKAEAPAEEAK